MKTLMKISVVILLAVVLASCSSGYAVVSSRPDTPYYNRPPALRADHDPTIVGRLVTGKDMATAGIGEKAAGTVK